MATFYAATNGGVFQSTNGGGNWIVVNTDLTSTTVHALAIDPTTPATLYAGTYGGGVFKSSNGGDNWGAVNTGLTDNYVYPLAMNVQALAIDPVTPNVLHAATDSDGVFNSSNGGASWSAVNLGLTNRGVYSLAVDPATPTTLYAGTCGGGAFDIEQGFRIYLPVVSRGYAGGW